MRASAALLFAAALLAGCAGVPERRGEIVSSERETVAQTKYGPVEGYDDAGIMTFKGIQYAKAERFMPPQYPDVRQNIRQCKIYGPAAPQGQSLEWGGEPSDYDFGFQFKVEKMSESGCQVLNVWTPGLDDKRRPVFVWIHGGGYASGSAIFLPCQEGRALAEKGDIVVVTVNHRLNVLGYLDLTALGGRYAQSVNLGMQDIVKALEWVRDNIAQFGGDPDCVTIGGQSGGGGKTSTLMAMPSAQGLFHRAIVQSGSTLRQAEPEQSRMLGLAVLQELGIAVTEPERLNDVSYEDLSAAASRASRRLAAEARERGENLRFSLSPVVDGEILSQHPFDGKAPEMSAGVPMLIGSNLNEFTYTNNVEVSEQQLRDMLSGRLGGAEAASAFIDEYSRVYLGSSFREMAYTDVSTRANVIRQATAKAALDAAPAYVYLFTWKSQISDGALAACHGMELPFMFSNVALQREMTGGTPSAYDLEDKVASAWISFIRNGDPNVPQLPEWRPWDEDGATMILDEECVLRMNHDRALLGL